MTIAPKTSISAVTFLGLGLECQRDLFGRLAVEVGLGGGWLGFGGLDSGGGHCCIPSRGGEVLYG
jgi:hypothetical protein